MTGKTRESQLKAVAKYDAEHTVQMHLKLNTGTDADILQWLESQSSKQGSIKSTIRKQMEKEQDPVEVTEFLAFMRAYLLEMTPERRSWHLELFKRAIAELQAEEFKSDDEED